MPAGEPTAPRPVTDGDRLRLAVVAVISRERITRNTLSKRTGVRGEVLGNLVNRGQAPSGEDAMALCGYMHLDPAEVQVPAKAKEVPAA